MREAFDVDFIDQLNATNDALRPAIATAMKAVDQRQRQRREALRALRGAHSSEQAS